MTPRWLAFMGLALLCAETGWRTTATAQDAAARRDERVFVLVVNRIFAGGILESRIILLRIDRGAPELPKAPARDSALVVVPPANPVTPSRIGPDFGDGQLWVRPLRLPPQELAQRIRKTDAQLADSVVKATIQAFLDSITREPGADRAELPEWSTEIAGKKFGSDKKYVTVAGLKIPATVLALIPLNGGTNESKAFDRTDQLLVDLRSAANQAQTVDDFKRAIGEMRKRKESHVSDQSWEDTVDDTEGRRGRYDPHS